MVRVGVPFDGVFNVDTKLSEPHSFPSLVSKMSAGNHTLYFFLQEFFLQNSVTSYIELVIEPLVSAQRTAEQQMKCKDYSTSVWNPPVITLRSDDGFMARDKKAYLTKDQLAKEGTVSVSERKYGDLTLFFLVVRFACESDKGLCYFRASSIRLFVVSYPS